MPICTLTRFWRPMRENAAYHKRDTRQTLFVLVLAHSMAPQASLRAQGLPLETSGMGHDFHANCMCIFARRPWEK